jgi:hypothetical protein
MGGAEVPLAVYALIAPQKPRRRAPTDQGNFEKEDKSTLNQDGDVR